MITISPVPSVTNAALADTSQELAQSLIQYLMCEMKKSSDSQRFTVQLRWGPLDCFGKTFLISIVDYPLYFIFNSQTT